MKYQDAHELKRQIRARLQRFRKAHVRPTSAGQFAVYVDNPAGPWLQPDEVHSFREFEQLEQR